MNDQEEYYDSLRCLRNSRRIRNDRLMGLNELITHTEEAIWTNESQLEILEGRGLDLVKTKPKFFLSTKAFPPRLSMAWKADIHPQNLRSPLKPDRGHLCTIRWIEMRWWRAFGKLLENIHVTWTHMRKKRDKIPALQRSGFKNCSHSLETTSQFHSGSVRSYKRRRQKNYDGIRMKPPQNKP
nr:hypothetical protein [Tanacetum cinerariifolium]